MTPTSKRECCDGCLTKIFSDFAGTRIEHYQCKNHSCPCHSPSVESGFLEVVWEALKGDHNDLRREQMILHAFRDAVSQKEKEVVEYCNFRWKLEIDAITETLEETGQEGFAKRIQSRAKEILDSVKARLQEKK